jgi:hypothetical protein
MKNNADYYSVFAEEGGVRCTDAPSESSTSRAMRMMGKYCIAVANLPSTVDYPNRGTRSREASVDL